MERTEVWSNLEAFLDAATPALRWRSLPMECFQEPNNLWPLDKKDVVEYFTLEDLWEHYAESSAYGLCVPVRLDNGETVIQHFVPYLSAIQIYTTKALTLPRSMGSECDSSSDESTGEKLSRSWDDASDDSVHDECDSLTAKRRGHLNFHFMDWTSPYERVPLAEKVAELAQDNPCLTSLKSVELSPASWMSIAWYPIYHIPAHGNLKDMTACFLTYHTISSVFQDSMQCDMNDDSSDKTAALSPFGLATYKMEGNLWRKPGSSDTRRIFELYGAATSWLKQVGAHHPDFNFFTAHSA